MAGDSRGSRKPLWKCAGCDFSNFAFREGCHSCGKKRSKSTRATGGGKGGRAEQPRNRGGGRGKGSGDSVGNRGGAKTEEKMANAQKELKKLCEENRQLRTSGADNKEEGATEAPAIKNRVAENDELDTLRKQLELCKLQGPDWVDKLAETNAKLDSKIASRRAEQPLSLRMRNLEEKEERAKKASEKVTTLEADLRKQLEACVADRAAKDEALKQIQTQQEALRHEKAEGNEAEATAAAEAELDKGLPIWQKVKAALGASLPEGAADLEA